MPLSRFEQKLQRYVEQIRAGERPTITPRQLVRAFGKERLGSNIRNDIRASLTRVGLRTVPDFAGINTRDRIAFELIYEDEPDKASVAQCGNFEASEEVRAIARIAPGLNREIERIMNQSFLESLWDFAKEKLCRKRSQ